MHDGLQRAWEEFRDARPGSRFRRYHRRRSQEQHKKWRKPLSIAAGIVIVVVGIVALPAPGPGMLVIAVGAGLLAREFGAVARLLDWLEVKGWRVRRWGVRQWNGWSTMTRIVVCGVVAAGAVFGSYVLFFR